MPWSIPIPIADAIVEYRARHGSFKSFEDLKSAPAHEGARTSMTKKTGWDFAAAVQ